MMAKPKKSYGKGGKLPKKMTPKTLSTAKGGSTDGMARSNFMAARDRSAEHMRGTAQMLGKNANKSSDSLRKRKYKKGGKVVAQGADKADVRAERKMARAIKRKRK